MNYGVSDSDVIDCDTDPFVFEGMSVFSHQKSGRLRWSQLKPKLWQWDQQMVDDGISGHLLARELVGMPILNANVLWFLVHNEHLIPEEWKGDTHICFWGTIFLNGRGGLNVSALSYGERGWEVGSKHLNEMFGRRHYAVLSGLDT